MAIPFPKGAVARLGSIRFRGGDQPVNAMRLFAGRPDPPHGQPGLPPANLGDEPAGSSIGCFRVPARPRAVSALPSPRTASRSPSPAWNARRHQAGSEPVRLVVDATTGKEVSRLPVTDRDSDLALAFTSDRKSLISLRSSGVFGSRRSVGRGTPPPRFRAWPAAHDAFAGQQARGDLDQSRREYPESSTCGTGKGRGASGS